MKIHPVDSEFYVSYNIPCQRQQQAAGGIYEKQDVGSRDKRPDTCSFDGVTQTARSGRTSPGPPRRREIQEIRNRRSKV